MRYILSLILVLTFGVSIGQVYNPTPQYVYRGKLGAGRSTAVDSAAYFQVGPNGGANAGVILPRVADTLSISGTKRNGLLIFSNQLNKFAWWDSTGAKWTEVGSGSATSGEVLLLNGSGSVGDSLLFSSISGDTAYVRNLWFANGLVVENMGDTVLKINIDSSTVANIYNSDGTITDERTVTIDDGNYLNILSSGNGGFVIQHTESTEEATLGIETDGAALYYGRVPTLAQKLAGIKATARLEDTTSPKIVIMASGGLYIGNTFDPVSGDYNKWLTTFTPLDSIMPVGAANDTAMYWNTQTGQVQRVVDRLSASATLDFGSTGAGAVSDLTVTVTGAAVGDVVSVGVPNGSVTATGVFFAWVSSSNTVTVRFSPKATEDPASGTFKVKVFK